MKYVECVLPETEGRFHYHLPTNVLHKKLEPGMRLLVPFARTWKVAYFIRDITTPDVPKTRAVLAFLDQYSLFCAKLFKLLIWISEYYMTPLGAVLKGALPQGIHVVPRRKFSLCDEGKTQTTSRLSDLKKEILNTLQQKKICTEQQLRKKFGREKLSRTLYDLKKKGLISETWECNPAPVRPKMRRIITLKIDEKKASAQIDTLQKTAPRQAEALQQLISQGGILASTDFAPKTRAALKSLIQKNLVRQSESLVFRKPEQDRNYPKKGQIVLNPAQTSALKEMTEAIALKTFSPFLLHGVTGSGKTEVYLHAIEALLKTGKGAILLLPEIGLTTHIAARFLEYFGDQVALLHSGLSAGERYDEWRRIREGQAKIVIGARSAIFAPLKSLGIIIVDEEHDASYRQDEGSRYHGRDVALVRARDEKAVVVLGSATPSFESSFNAENGKYRYLQLKERVDARPLPIVKLVNLKEKKDWVRPFFTQKLYDALKIRLGKKEQTLLFVNRRGFSPFLLCHDCGFTPLCHHCTVSLTFHKGLKQLVCHYCGYQSAPTTTCPDCKGYNVTHVGVGTEQIEECIRHLFPKARTARLDRDTTQKKGAYGQILGAMAREEVDVLIGTQMIAKGHDFPKVTLVGVIAADLSLHVPDFRSAERTFQILAQVAGRAGRGEHPGEVIVQSFQIENPTIQAATTHDYTDFYQTELGLRKAQHYPPYSRLALLLLRHKDETSVEKAASELALCIKKTIKSGEIKMLGPAPASLIRLREEYRYQILLKGADQQKISKVLKIALKIWKTSAEKNVKLNIEIDPQQFV
ncbi:Helicase PriA essential for oriC/DnaA-independent DNA replication [hydrothermal vent metagenome]|uniref:DNA 3'-5' helicase n=1 Tax=hydrothermal vent metagenome TaxID=652676 RepID=A0A3B1DB70_9ZZZZ